ncbi:MULTISPECIES: XRE family transcriptional regulator [unclassified Pseudomonas]|uniref:LexA family transcriptional regulator n=1 Tax=unclassified Pseudomonas TaxID=196821 RepID=UPI000837C01F|nr:MULTISPECIES: XRE family transcriptional regulator [unclassified Pseudomonas]QIH07146.1 helix-turn-helix domain-containing protein [Pseudomonas sp. BIOMIG1BAC]
MTKKPTYIAEESSRLKKIYQERKKQDPSLSQDKVAEDCGWSSQSVVSQYMTGRIPLNISALISLSRALRFAPESVSPRLAETLAQASSAQIDTTPTNGHWHRNTTDMGSAGRLLPVIGYEEAVAFLEADDGTQRIETEEWVEAGGPAGPRAFILRVEGRSMEPDFKAGDKVVIDPEMPWKSGDFVVAKRVTDKAVSLKQISQEGGELYLYATNPDWPERVVKASDEWLVIGRARRKIVDL